MTWKLIALLALMLVVLMVLVCSYLAQRKLASDFKGWDASDSERIASDVIAFTVTAMCVVGGIAALLLCIHLYARPAHAHDGDDDLSQWYRSLVIPGTQQGCCSMVDCAPVQHRETPDGYEALINDQWMKVPPGAVLNQISNPTGQAVACYLPSRGIMCFVRPSEV